MSTDTVQRNDRRTDARQVTRLAPLLLAAGVLLLIGWLGVKAWRVVRLAQSLQAHQVRAEVLAADGLMNIDPDAAEALVMDLRRDVVALDREVRPFLPLAERLAWLPRVGPVLRHSEALMEMADAGSEAAAYAVRGLKPALQVVHERRNGQGDLVVALLPALQSGEADLFAASSALERAIAARAAINSLDGFPWRVRTIIEMIDEKLYLADELRLLTVFPAIMGADGPRTYLVLAQNEDETRPTGGFLTGAGLLSVDSGEIVDLSFQDGNTIDDWRSKPYDMPPEPLYRLMGLELFLFRDANFWPDFPTSAEQAMELYSYGQDNAPALDGAIAIDQQFVAMLVAVTGPVNVPQLETTVTSANVVATLREAWGAGEGEEHAEWIVERKDFLGPLAQALQAQLLGGFDSIDPLYLADTMHRAAQEKHLQIYMRDPEVARILDEINWDGRLELPATGDYFMVLDTNVGYNKVNPLVDSAISYDVALLSDGTATAELTIQYTHNGEETDSPCRQITPYALGITYDVLMNQCFWNYLRIYAPAGISPLHLDEHPIEHEIIPVTTNWTDRAGATIDTSEAGTIIANTFVLPQGQTLTSQYGYRLPVVVLDGEQKSYQLEVKKQAGVGAQQIIVRLTVPPGTSIVDVSPAIGSINGRQVTWETEFLTDLTFDVSYR